MPEERDDHGGAGTAPGNEPSASPIGFLSLRLEHTPAGVRATVCWNADVERRHNDRQTQTLDLDGLPYRVHDFVRTFVERRPV